MHADPVLLIDDDPLVLKTLASMLRLRMQVTVETSDSTVGALARIRATDYAALLCEAGQPRLSGQAFARAVRKLRPETPILFMLDRHDPVLARRMVEAGAYDLLTKPIEEETWLLAITRALEVSRLRRQVRDQEGELLAVLDDVMDDLEGLYHAYGLRGHLDALLAKAMADRQSKISAPPTAFAVEGAWPRTGPRDRNTPLPSES